MITHVPEQRVRPPKLLPCPSCDGTGKLHANHGDSVYCGERCWGTCGRCEGSGTEWQR